MNLLVLLDGSSRGEVQETDANSLCSPLKLSCTDILEITPRPKELVFEVKSLSEGSKFMLNTTLVRNVSLTGDL